MRPGRRRKTEFTNCILKIRVNYETAITFITLALPQLLDVRVHASLVEPPRRRSSCPHRFTTPNPSSPLPRVALEPELGLPRARERSSHHGRRRGSASPWRSPLRPPFARSEPADSFPEPLCSSTTISPPPKGIGAPPPRSSAAAGRLYLWRRHHGPSQPQPSPSTGSS